MSLTGRPSRPPLALISFSQIWAPSSACWPAPASEPVCAMVKPILIGSPSLCAKAGVLARTGEIRAPPMPALTWRRVMRWVMVSSQNSVGLRRGDAWVDRKIQELSASKIHLGHPRAYASSAVRKMSETDLDLLQKCLPAEGTMLPLTYGNGTFRWQFLNNIRQFNGRVE